MKRKTRLRKPPSLRLMQTAFAKLGPHFPGYFSKLAYKLWFTTHRFKRPEAENLAADRAERSIIEINNIPVTVWSWGKGRPVLFIHGWSGRGTQAVHFLQPLIDSGYRVISFDAPAHGETKGTRTNMLEIAEVILALGENLGPFHGAITHSFGGMILAYATSKGFSPQCAVCICPPASIDTILLNFQQSLELPATVFAAMKARLYAHYGSDLDRRASTLKNVQALSIPALIVHDKQDRDVPWQDGKAVADAWPGAEFMLTRGLGHRRILRDPATVTAVADFITSR